ncbi:MAG: hypothetical protein AAFQ35_07290, partial [Pseudomonadota bacterium]
SSPSFILALARLLHRHLDQRDEVIRTLLVQPERRDLIHPQLTACSPLAAVHRLASQPVKHPLAGRRRKRGEDVVLHREGLLAAHRHFTGRRVIDREKLVVAT